MSSYKSNERLSYKIGTIGLPQLARSLLTLIGSCRINYIFKKKVSRFRKRYLSCNSLLRKKVLLSPIFLKTTFQTCKSNRALHLCNDWWSRKSSESKDSQFYQLCVPTDLIWLTKSFNKKSWIAATAVLFNTHIKTNILASWWIMTMLGCITTIKWWKIDLKCSWLQAR